PPWDVTAQGCAKGTLGALPRRDVWLFGDSILGLLRVGIGDHSHEGREFFLVGGAADDPDSGRLRGGVGHSGMFPCFLGGSSARLPLSDRNAFAIDTRVLAGSMMPSS